MVWLAAAVCLAALAGLVWLGRMLMAGSVNRGRRIRDLGLEARFAELDRLADTGAMPWDVAKRTQRLELRLAEYEDELRTMVIPPGEMALFEPSEDDGGVELEALESLFNRGLLERAPEGKGFVKRRPSGTA